MSIHRIADIWMGDEEFLKENPDLNKTGENFHNKNEVQARYMAWLKKKVERMQKEIDELKQINTSNHNFTGQIIGQNFDSEFTDEYPQYRSLPNANRPFDSQQRDKDYQEFLINKINKTITNVEVSVSDEIREIIRYIKNLQERVERLEAEKKASE